MKPHIKLYKGEWIVFLGGIPYHTEGFKDACIMASELFFLIEKLK